MFKRRRSHLPKLPVSPEEFDQLLTNSPYSKFHRLTIRNCDEKALVFASDLMLLKLKEAEIIHFDATFDVVPRIFYQLLTIFIRVKGHAIPALHILMTSKSEHLYTAVALAIHELVAEFNSSIAMCDFEKASLNAFKTVFTNITIVGCWFHYTKAIHDKVQKIGLAKLYKTNKSFKKWVHELMALPFLPEEDITSTYFAIKKSFVDLTPTEMELVKSLENYFYKTWIDGNESMSVFYYQFSTNNNAESYHKSLKSNIKTSHPNIWKFLSSLEDIILDFDLEMRRLEEGLLITRGSNPKSRKNADLRIQYKNKYLNRVFTAIEYINAISSTIGKQNKTKVNPNDQEHSNTEQSELSDDGEHTNSRCYVCLQQRIDNFGLLHDGFAHAGFCEISATEIHRLRQVCPICR